MTEEQKSPEAVVRAARPGGTRTGFILGGILLFAFSLRAVGTDQVFSAVEMPVTSLMAGFRLTLAPWLGGETLLENFFVQLVLFYRGITAPLILYIDLSLLRLFGVRYSEFLLVFPFILVGLLGLVAVYALGRRFFGVRTGLLAVLFAVRPCGRPGVLVSGSGSSADFFLLYLPGDRGDQHCRAAVPSRRETHE